MRIAKDALSKEFPASLAEKKFNSLKPDELYMKCVDLCSRKDSPTSVILQGDCWVPNFLIRDLPKNEKEVLILDFQLARCSSPVLDISFMIYSCTDEDLRSQHFDNFLKEYYDELNKSIASLGSDPEKLYSRETFMKEVYMFICISFKMKKIELE